MSTTWLNSICWWWCTFPASSFFGSDFLFLFQFFLVRRQNGQNKRSDQYLAGWPPIKPNNFFFKSHMLPFLVFLVNFYIYIDFYFYFNKMREEFEFEICTIHFAAEKMHFNMSNSLLLSRLNLGTISSIEFCFLIFCVEKKQNICLFF